MVRYLLRHPISVVMTFLALFIIGGYMFLSLPVTLLPNIDIPIITVKASMAGMGAEEMEATIVTPLRRSLLQCNGLKEVKSRTTDGSSTISLSFNHGIDTELSFIEVNEKIDAAMSSMPRNAVRPKAIKSNTTDIPVFFLHMSLKDYQNTDDSKFIELGQLAEKVVRKRVEQLPQVAMVDITGIPSSIIRIEADKAKLERLDITMDALGEIIAKANFHDVSFKVNDKQYVYDVRIDNDLYLAEDIASLHFAKGGRQYALRDLCKIEKTERTPEGYAMLGDKRAITLAVIKKTEDRMGDLQESIYTIINELSSRYPEIEFRQSQDQTEFLSVTITNLVQNLVLGLLLVFLLTLIFIGNLRIALIIGISVIVALVTSVIAFGIFKVSINIISLSGMILAVGMMIDNSTIVSENILQIKEMGNGWTEACDIGTSEMITPLLSSMLTTIAVFLPLIFISGIGGALFADQAFSISAGLISSYIISIILLPVIIMLAHGSGNSWRNGIAALIPTVSKRINDWMQTAYERIMSSMTRYKKVVVTVAFLILILCWPASTLLRVEMLPQITHADAVVKIDWGENINADENARRIAELCRIIEKKGGILLITAEIGHQDYMLEGESDMQQNQSRIYLKTRSKNQLHETTRLIEDQISVLNKKAKVTFSDPDNVFTKVFDTSTPAFEIRLSKSGHSTFPYDKTINHITENLARYTGTTLPPVASDSILAIRINRDKLQRYGISIGEVVAALKMELGAEEVGMLQSSSQQLPIYLTYPTGDFPTSLDETMVKEIPVSNFIVLEPRPAFKEIVSSSHGQYIPLNIKESADMNKLNEDIVAFSRDVQSDWNIYCTGSYFESKGMMRQMLAILGISIILMYFILCSQFENFLQPLIVLAEIPIDSFFAFIVLWIFGFSLNIMTAIGIIVTCGIVVNDSILKISAINDYRQRGFSIDDAIHLASIRRLRPIILTSLTTVFAMVPTLFGYDMGSELQKPMAVAMIASMTIGTLVSIFFIPIIYKFIYRLEK